MIDLTFAIISAIAYGVAPIFYKPALQCTMQLRAMSVFSTYSILLGLLLPWKTLDIAGVLYAIVAGSIGGVFGSWLYLTSIKIGGAAVGNISSSMYIVLLPLLSGKWWLWPSAGLVLLGIATAAFHRDGELRGALFGVSAAVVWSFSIMLYAHAVDKLGVGGALFIRGITVFTLSTLLGLRGRICKLGRLIGGGFLDTFIGFGSYTYAISQGDYVRSTIVVSTYPLLTSILEKPLRFRKVLGAAIAFLGVLYIFIV